MKRKTKTNIIICAGITSAALLVVLYTVGVLDVIYAEFQIRRPSVYKPVTRDMTVLASHLKASKASNIIREQNIGWSWQPESVQKIPANHVILNPYRIVINFGGGFYPLAYHLFRNEGESDPNSTVWELYISREKTGPKLYTYRVTKGDQAAFVNLIRSAAVEYDRQIADHPDSEEYKTQKENFLELFDVKLDDDGVLQMPQP